MRTAEHNRSLTEGLRILSISAVELWFLTLVYIAMHFVIPGWMSLIGFVLGYLICRAADSIEPHFLESFLLYLAQPRSVKKR